MTLQHPRYWLKGPNLGSLGLVPATTQDGILLSISSIIGWWNPSDANKVTIVSGNVIRTLTDGSPTNTHLTAAAENFPVIASSGSKNWMNFTTSGNRDIHSTSIAITGAPFSLYFIFVPRNNTDTQVAVFIGDGGHFNSQYEAKIAGASSGDPGIIFIRDSGTQLSINTINSFVVGMPHLMNVNVYNTHDFEVILDNNLAMAGRVSNTTVIPININRIAIGREADLNPSQNTDGLIGETMLFREVLNATNHNKVLDYLTGENWGLSLVR